MKILQEREKTHGDYKYVAQVSQALKSVLTSFPDELAFQCLPDVHRESLEMICVKMARILCGDHNEKDHWTDIIGYAQLVLNHIKEVPGSSPQQETPDEETEICNVCGLCVGHLVWCPKR